MPHIYQINLSDGGVPKFAVRQVDIYPTGLAGDRQEDLLHHGGPERAVCLFSLERILALQHEGHPIFAGAAGENLTLADLDWDQMQPGKRLHIGKDIWLEITRYTTPCNNLIPYFKKGDFSRISQKIHPGWSRVYARVLQPGACLVSDRVELS